MPLPPRRARTNELGMVNEGHDLRVELEHGNCAVRDSGSVALPERLSTTPVTAASVGAASTSTAGRLRASLGSAEHSGEGKDKDWTASSSGGSFKKFSRRFSDKYAADKHTILQAFRLIGGSEGISHSELRSAISTVRTKNVRKELHKNLTGLFETIGKDKNGRLDIVEFGHIVQKSTFLQKAIYELTEQAQEDEARGFRPQGHLSTDTPSLRWLDVFASVSSSLSVGLLIIQTDMSPQWNEWYLIEFCFMLVFSLEIAVRSTLVCKHETFFASPMNAFDVAISLIGWVDVIAFLCVNSVTGDALAPLRWFRILRLARGVRLRRSIFCYCNELQVLIACILNSMRFVIWASALLFLFVLAWALTVRIAVKSKWGKDVGVDSLNDIFSSTPESMLVIFRCMVLRADGAGMFFRPGDVGQPTTLFDVLSDRFGWAFDITWTASEFFISLGVCNVIIALFVVQAGENVSQVRDSINDARVEEYQMLLTRLDKLLRTLIHPGREQCNPKDRNAAEVAKLIRTKNPEVAEHIPNMEMQIVRLAKSIQEAKKLHQSAMDAYEAEDVKACRELFAIPSAQTYFVNGEERLLADDTADVNNPLKLRVAPMGAVEVLMDQPTDCLETLLDDASEVQQVVKKVIYPNSQWATEEGAGSSGHIWKQSKGLCDEAIDPGTKSLERIEQKIIVKYAGRTQRNRDYARLSLVFDSVGNLVKAIPRLLKFDVATVGMQVMTLENRFANPQPLGWRDVTMLLKVVVPTTRDGSSEPRFHMMELQLRLKGLMELNHESHEFYEEIRSALPDDVLGTILDRLVTDTTLDLGITKSEWLQCLRNRQVVKILDDLQVPSGVCRRSLFDLIDVDNSGTVTSSELRETLRFYTQPMCAPELQGCHALLKDLQRHMQTKVDPHLQMLEQLPDVIHELSHLVMETRGTRPSTRPSTRLSTKTDHISMFRMAPKSKSSLAIQRISSAGRNSVGMV